MYSAWDSQGSDGSFLAGSDGAALALVVAEELQKLSAYDASASRSVRGNVTQWREVTFKSMYEMSDWGNTIDFSALMLALGTISSWFSQRWLHAKSINISLLSRWFGRWTKNQATNARELSTPSKQSECRSADVPKIKQRHWELPKCSCLC